MAKRNLLKLVPLFVTILMILNPATAHADLSQDQKNVYHEGAYYFDIESCNAGSTLSIGKLPTVIPEPYNAAFTSGAQKFNVDPALVAGIFTEENLTGAHTSELPNDWKAFAAGTLGELAGGLGGKHRPVGNPNAGWPHSSAGAEGPFQFIPSTWATDGVDNSGDNRADINNLLDASASAANLLAKGGATANKPPGDWHNAIFSYNHADWYVNAVLTYYNYYKTGKASDVTPALPSTVNACGQSATGPSGCKNPFRDIQADKKLRPERIDMGVDYAGGSPNEKVYAICSGTIENLVNSGWDFGGYDAFISIKIDTGPAAGLYSYMAEDCVPKPGLVPGKTHVTSDTPICNMTDPGGTGIETGWAAPPGDGETMAALAGQYHHDGNVTAFGVNYNDLLKALGCPSGTGNTSNPVGSLPARWPQWK